MGKLAENEIEFAKEIYERKCVEPSCFNYRMPGVIYCVSHRYGEPRRMSVDEKKLLTRYIKQFGKKIKTS